VDYEKKEEKKEAEIQKKKDLADKVPLVKDGKF